MLLTKWANHDVAYAPLWMDHSSVPCTCGRARVRVHGGGGRSTCCVACERAVSVANARERFGPACYNYACKHTWPHANACDVASMRMGAGRGWRLARAHVIGCAAAIVPVVAKGTQRVQDQGHSIQDRVSCVSACLRGWRMQRMQRERTRADRSSAPARWQALGMLGAPWRVRRSRCCASPLPVVLELLRVRDRGRGGQQRERQQQSAAQQGHRHGAAMPRTHVRGTQADGGVDPNNIWALAGPRNRSGGADRSSKPDRGARWGRGSPDRARCGVQGLSGRRLPVGRRREGGAVVGIASLLRSELPGLIYSSC